MLHGFVDSRFHGNDEILLIVQGPQGPKSRFLGYGNAIQARLCQPK